MRAVRRGPELFSGPRRSATRVSCQNGSDNMTTNNALKTVFLLGLLSGILIVGGRFLAGPQGMAYAA